MALLYDAHGNPIDKTRLRREIAVPTVTGVRQILSGHPAQNLEPRRLASLMLAAEYGDAVSYLELAEEMEEKDMHYRSVLSTRKLQVSGLPITVEAASDAAEDVKAADLVRDFVNSEVLQGAAQDIMDAVGKGYSVCELLWDTQGRTWMPTAIAWRDPRWFGFDRADGVTLRMKGETGQLEPLTPAKFIVHIHKSKSGLPIRGGLARSVAWYYLFKNFDIKAWVQFAQVYGFPLRLGRYDRQATEEERQTLLRAVRNITQDAAAIIPEDMRIEFQSTDVRGNASIFQGMAEYFDRQISKLVLGQTGTTDVGQHVGTANAHERVREDIAASDAAQLSATLNRDLVRPLVALNLGPRKRYPALKVALEKTEDVSAWVDNVVKLAPIAANLVETSVIRDKLGVPEPSRGAEVVGAPGGGTDEGRPFRAMQSARDLKAVSEPDPVTLAVNEEMRDWRRLAAPLAAPVLELAEQCAEYEEFLAALPELARGQDVTALAEALSLAMFAQRVKASGNG